MGLFRGVLLGTGAALVSVAAAQAADLPSRKAAPVEYVRVCDSYGSGFFFIPGTDTCIKIGGRVRADYGYVPAQNWQPVPTATPFAANSAVTGAAVTISGTSFATLVVPSGTRYSVTDALRPNDLSHQVGWEARGRIEFDARTRTSWGVVRTVAQFRMARTTGVFGVDSGAQSASASPTLEAAYVQFAGFTFGAARDNFAFMPSRMYGAGHWAAFANGAKQIAYTHVFGGGLAATVALQDPVDTTVGMYDYTWRTGTAPGSMQSKGPQEVANLPQVNANLQWTQGWGELFLAGAARRIDISNNRTTSNVLRENETAWAVGAGLKLNLPMIASGNALWLTAAYADGMTEYTTNFSSFKSSAGRRDVGGVVINHPSYVVSGNNGAADDIHTVQSWNIAALYDHFWSPQWRSTLMASYGQINAPQAARNCIGNSSGDLRFTGTALASGYTAASSMANGCFGDATVWNVGKQLAWMPTRNMEIGVEVLYARTNLRAPAGGFGANQDGTDVYTGMCANNAASCSFNNVTGRLRVERSF